MVKLHLGHWLVQWSLTFVANNQRSFFLCAQARWKEKASSL